MAQGGLEYVIDLIDGSFGKNIQKAQQQTSKLDGLVKRVGAGVAAVFTVQKVWGLVEESTKVRAEMEALDTKIKIVSGSTEQYTRYTQALGSMIDNLALPIKETTEL
ncbi:MAG: hypothetical protein M0R38_09005 [Bacteroidia bacterium]|nr:hypothetical protein [Bacteroidia bacterium]